MALSNTSTTNYVALWTQQPTARHPSKKNPQTIVQLGELRKGTFPDSWESYGSLQVGSREVKVGFRAFVPTDQAIVETFKNVHRESPTEGTKEYFLRAVSADLNFMEIRGHSPYTVEMERSSPKELVLTKSIEKDDSSDSE